MHYKSNIVKELKIIDKLGEQHIKNTVLRKGIKGDKINGWFFRIFEWDLTENGEKKVVVDRKGDYIYSNAGCQMDLNSDGVGEVITSRHIKPTLVNDFSDKKNKINEIIWFEEVEEQEKWVEHKVAEIYQEDLWSRPHDFVPIQFKIDGEIVRGVVGIFGRKNLMWFEIPKDPTKEWKTHKIATFTEGRHSGIGITDLTGNGKNDIICGMYWLECPDDPRKSEWKKHRYAEWDKNDWGGMTKIAIGDLDGDGFNEICVTEAEIPDARMAIFKPGKNPNEYWDFKIIDNDFYAPHSLILTDINKNGLIDIVVGEMKAGGWEFEKNPEPKIMVYYNKGDLNFSREVLINDLAIHEMKLVKDKKESRLLFYGADEIQEHKFDGMNTDILYWTVD